MIYVDNRPYPNMDAVLEALHLKPEYAAKVQSVMYDDNILILGEDVHIVRDHPRRWFSCFRDDKRLPENPPLMSHATTSRLGVDHGDHLD